MSDHDMSMLRGEKPGHINLAVGEPYFLQETLYFTGERFRPRGDPRYPAFAGEQQLIDEIKKYHGGAYNYVVVANGAKQALLAAFYAYSEGYGYKRVHTNTPYWPTYPTLAKLSGLKLELNKTYIDPGLFDVITSPNNPDGKEFTGGSIWDAAYAHSVYGHTAAPSHEVAVWSAAKLFGLSGCRVGWLTTNNRRLAEEAAKYIEKTTSGVCTDAQHRIADILNYVNTVDVSEAYQKARARLLRNGLMFEEYMRDIDILEEYHGVPGEGKGMFAWFKVWNPDYVAECFKAAKVDVIRGSAFGASDHWFRMSMGHRPDPTERALEAFTREFFE